MGDRDVDYYQILCCEEGLPSLHPELEVTPSWWSHPGFHSAPVESRPLRPSSAATGVALSLQKVATPGDRGYWRLSRPGSKQPVAQPIAPAQVTYAQLHHIALDDSRTCGYWGKSTQTWVSVPSSWKDRLITPNILCLQLAAQKMLLLLTYELISSVLR